MKPPLTSIQIVTFLLTERVSLFVSFRAQADQFVDQNANPKVVGYLASSM